MASNSTSVTPANARECRRQSRGQPSGRLQTISSWAAGHPAPGLRRGRGYARGDGHSCAGGARADRAAEVGGVRHPAEELLDVVDRRLLQERRPGLVCGVFQEHAEIFQEEAVAQGAFDADIGGDAAEGQILHAPRPEQAVEGGIVEGAVARLGDDDVAALRCQLVHQGVVPGPLGQQRPLQLRPVAHGLQRIGLPPVGRSFAAGLDIVAIPAVLEENHGDARRPRRLDRHGDLVDRGGGPADVEAGDVQVAAGGGVGILHVHHDQRRGGGIDGQVLRPRRQRHRALTRNGRAIRRRRGHASSSSSAAGCAGRTGRGRPGSRRRSASRRPRPSPRRSRPSAWPPSHKSRPGCRC